MLDRKKRKRYYIQTTRASKLSDVVNRYDVSNAVNNEQSFAIKEMISMVENELILKFEKTPMQASSLVQKADLPGTLKSSPLSLHISPREWAVKVLTKNNEIEVLEKYYLSL